MKPRVPKVTYANVVSSIALFVALGGVSYAAVTLPAGSVGHKQVRASAITSQQIRDHTLRKRDFRAGILGAAGLRGPQGEPGPQGERGPQGPAGDPAAALTPNSVGTSELKDDSVTFNKLGIVSVSQTSADNANSPKLVQVDCPAGTTIVSGGAGITHNLVPAPGTAALSYDVGLPFQNGWAAEAYSTSAGSSWALTVVAICIKN